MVTINKVVKTAGWLGGVGTCVAASQGAACTPEAAIATNANTAARSGVGDVLHVEVRMGTGGHGSVLGGNDEAQPKTASTMLSGSSSARAQELPCNRMVCESLPKPQPLLASRGTTLPSR